MNNETPRGTKAESCEEIDWYRFFAYLIGPPTRERFGRITQPGLQATIANLWEGMACTGDLPRNVMFGSFEHYEACYIAVFDVGAPEPPVPLLESFYHNTVPAQHTVLENAWFYDVIKLRTAASISSPDHLLSQLEFCASVRYLEETCSEEPQRHTLCRLERDFIDRHLLTWIPTALAKLQELGPPVFPAWFALLVRFLRCRLEELANAGAQPGFSSISNFL
jgi:TorA maturation chaperone TorD